MKRRGKRRRDAEGEGWSSAGSWLADNDAVWVSEETWTAVDKEVGAG